MSKNMTTSPKLTEEQKALNTIWCISTIQNDDGVHELHEWYTTKETDREI